jgi:anti-sigma factor ChrR (cupin superfamily)
VKTVRPAGLEPVLDLARRLAEEFDSVPLPMVSRAVKSAAQAVALFGDAVADSLPTVERIAREDLLALSETAAEQSLAESA